MCQVSVTVQDLRAEQGGRRPVDENDSRCVVVVVGQDSRTKWTNSERLRKAGCVDLIHAVIQRVTIAFGNLLPGCRGPLHHIPRRPWHP